MLEMAVCWKTQVVILKDRKKLKPITLNLNGIHVISQNTIKYLGVTIDEDIIYGYHVMQICRKAKSVLGVLSMLIHKIYGPK